MSKVTVDYINFIGIEIFINFSEIETSHNTQFYTDSNSYNFVYRDRNLIRYEDFVASSYFPMAHGAFLFTEAGNVTFKEQTNLYFHSAFPHGVSSRADNHIEMMIHRRTLKDDYKGLEEPMDDQTVIQGQVKLNFQSSANFKNLAEYSETISKLEKFYSFEPTILDVQGFDNRYKIDQDSASIVKDTRSFISDNLIASKLLKQKLPNDIYLLSFQNYDNNSEFVETTEFIIRFQNLKQKPVTLADPSKFKSPKEFLMAHFNFLNDRLRQIDICNISAIDCKKCKIEDLQILNPVDIVTIRIEFSK